MEYRNFKGKKVSLLGYGCMRFPVKDGHIDEIRAAELLRTAYNGGVNYFDTAYPYHEGTSERFVGKILSEFDRKTFYLADKMPFWNVSSVADMERIFFEQLEKCRVEYFDFYLCHAMNEEHFEKLIRIDGLDFLLRMKSEGKIKNLGFSFHDAVSVLERYVGICDWDFAQIQYNYLDCDMQRANLQYEILKKRGIPVIVMEPVRGGMLAKLSDDAERILRQEQPDCSIASWAIRFAATPEGVLTVLSGMTDMNQLTDNLKTFDEFKPIEGRAAEVLSRALEDFRTNVVIPCTGCRYCMDCPRGVDIPKIFAMYNKYMLSKDNVNYRLAYRSLDNRVKAAHCVSCGKCRPHCPQGIDIPARLAEIDKLVR